MKSTQDIFLLVGRVVLGLAFVAEGLRQIEVWPEIVGLFRRADAPYPFELGVATVTANLVAPMLLILGIRARAAALVLAVVTAAGLYLLHRVDLGAPDFQRSVAIIGALLLVGGAGPGRHALEPGG
jgi:putative oxidoreductase